MAITMALTTRLIERNVGFSLNASIKALPPPLEDALKSAKNIPAAPFLSHAKRKGFA
jgi:hypothetical protein